MAYELVFFGGTTIRYRRNHGSFEDARAEAHRVLAKMAQRAAHPAIIYGPDCGRDGVTIA